MKRETYHHGDLKQALVESGMKILVDEGVSALTLRSAARAAGVSHSAPYAHFKDKKALLAAIASRGFQDLYQQLRKTLNEYRNSPRNLLIETGWTYTSFALNKPNCFNLMFSGILGEEHAYPEFNEAVQKTYQELVDIVEICQSGNVLRTASTEVSIISVWSLVHGFISLYLEQQFPGRVLEKYQLKSLLQNSLAMLEPDNNPT